MSLSYEGSSHFRARLCASILSGKSLLIRNIRSEGPSTSMEGGVPVLGLQDFEASFLRLIDSLTDGSIIQVNETGTKLKFKPGLLIGGAISHQCAISRSIGWYLEGILPLLPFCKENSQLTFYGVTNDGLDISVDTLKSVTLPLLRNFGVEGSSLKIVTRGAAPKGGGVVEVFVPVVRSFRPIYAIHTGKIRRIRGTVFCSKISPTIISRVVDSAKAVLNRVITDVYIASDHHKGATSGLSAGYSITLIAETTTGVNLSVERSAGQEPGRIGELPETVGEEAALMLLEEMSLGGVVDRTHQSLALQLMVLGPEEVCKIRFGNLTDQAVATLRILRDAFGTVFKITEDNSKSHGGGVDGGEDEEEDDDEGGKLLMTGQKDGEAFGRKYTDEAGTVLLSCLGLGFVNMARKIR